MQEIINIYFFFLNSIRISYHGKTIQEATTSVQTGFGCTSVGSMLSNKPFSLLICAKKRVVRELGFSGYTNVQGYLVGNCSREHI